MEMSRASGSNRIEQVLSNLIGNAVMHGVDPILVTTRREGDRVITSVHNHGTPIPEAQMATLFDPFTRGAGTERSAPKGLGLGLYIAREIVRVHGGTLDGHLDREDGTTFTFSLARTIS